MKLKSRKKYSDSKKTGKQAIGYLQVYSLELNGEIKWYKSRLEALRVCDENKLMEIKCYSILQDKPAYMFLNFLNGNYTVECIPMKRTRNYSSQFSKYKTSDEFKQNCINVGIDLTSMPLKELMELGK